jgi:hypothetical protein
MPRRRKTGSCAFEVELEGGASVRRFGERRSVTSVPVAAAIACSSESLGSRLPFSMRLSWLPATPTIAPSSSRVSPCDAVVADAVAERRQFQGGGGHSLSIAKESRFLTTSGVNPQRLNLEETLRIAPPTPR